MKPNLLLTHRNTCGNCVANLTHCFLTNLLIMVLSAFLLICHSFCLSQANFLVKWLNAIINTFSCPKVAIFPPGEGGGYGYDSLLL